MALKHKHLLGIEGLEPEEITYILDTAGSLKEISYRDIKKVPTLRGKTIVNLFFEASTRTRSSFEIAAKRLSADTVNLSSSGSSVVKGETLRDTVKNIQAMRPDAVVIRHKASGVPYMLTKWIDAPVINAGDGTHEHPTQALLDLFTIKERKEDLKGLKVAIIGDIGHSRVARSNIYILTKMGLKVRVAGPPTMIPPGMDVFPVDVYHRPEEAIEGVDVIMMLRIQMERQRSNLFPGTREYAMQFGLNNKRVSLAKKDVIILHPGPLNRGVEISTDVADGPYSVILDQVENGIAVRMAVLYLLLAEQT